MDYHSPTQLPCEGKFFIGNGIWTSASIYRSELCMFAPTLSICCMGIQIGTRIPSVLYMMTIKKNLLPKTACTSIWWLCDKRSFNAHDDKICFGPTFVFVPETYEGGELTFVHPDNPDIKATYLMKEGTVIAGRWDCSIHYTQNFTGNRYVFVMYADKHIVNRFGKKGLKDETWRRKPAFLRNQN
jgi:hypothetical protein